MSIILRYIIYTLLGLSPAISFGQHDFNWENKIPIISPIPDSLIAEDAVILLQTENRKIVKEKSHISTVITLRKKIKILTEEGIKAHSFFRIKQSSDMEIEILDARTIKPNGVIIDFESNEIKSMESISQTNGKSKDLFFAIPAVEIGDEVEMICKYNCINFKANDFIYFHQSIPVLKSIFSITAPKKVIVKSNVYNGLELPNVRYNLYNNTISWTCYNNQKTSFQNEVSLYLLPHLIYQLDYRNLTRVGGQSSFSNWHDLITYFEKTALKPKVRDQKKMRLIWKEIANGETDKTKLITIIHEYLNQHIEMTTMFPHEKSEGIEYFLQHKKADQILLLKMYFALLDMAEIKAKLAVGQSRNIGPIDLKIPTTAQISHFLFVIENQGNITLLAPKEETNHFAMHELPNLLYGTSIYMVSSKRRKKLGKIDIPHRTN